MRPSAHISFAQTDHVNAALRYLTHLGAPVDQLLLASHAPVQILSEDSGLVPLAPFLQLMDLAESELGIADLGVQVGQHAGTVVGAWSNSTLHCSLGQFVNQSAHRYNRASSGARFWIDWDAEHLLFNWQGLDDVAGRVQADGFVLAQSLANVRYFLGAQWKPAWMSIRHGGRHQVDAFSAALDCEVRPSEKFNSLPIPLALLRQRLAEGPKSITVQTASLQPPADFIAQLELFVAATMADGEATLQNAADAAGVSRRTMQRLLRKRGLSFAQVVERVRMQSAVRLLNSPCTSVIDVALQLGYSDPSNFTRAFRRHVGAPPSQWRRLAGLGIAAT